MALCLGKIAIDGCQNWRDMVAMDRKDQNIKFSQYYFKE